MFHVAIARSFALGDDATFERDVAAGAAKNGPHRARRIVAVAACARLGVDVVVVCAGERSCSHSVLPGQRFTLCDFRRIEVGASLGAAVSAAVRLTVFGP